MLTCTLTWDAVIVCVRPDVTVCDGERLPLRDIVPLIDGESLKVLVLVALTVGAWVLLEVAEGVGAPDDVKLPVVERVAEAVRLWLSVGRGEVDSVPVAVGDWLADPGWLGDDDKLTV